MTVVIICRPPQPRRDRAPTQPINFSLEDALKLWQRFTAEQKR